MKARKKEQSRFSVSVWTVVFAACMAISGRGFMLVGYFIAVVLHEMAHAEAARKRGYALVRIKIMPYGASLTGAFEGMSRRDECAVAIAGPLCNLCLAALVTALWWVAPVTYFFTETFAYANIFTFLTNMLPVFPLDGGRITVALLSGKMPRQKAYTIVRAFGAVVCALFAALFVLSLLRGGNITFAMMAFFVGTSTVFPDKQSRYQRLYTMAFRSEKLKHGLCVREIMVSDTLSLYALTKMLSGNYYARFAVMNARLEQTATVTETQLEALLVRFAPDTPLCEIKNISGGE